MALYRQYDRPLSLPFSLGSIPLYYFVIGCLEAISKHYLALDVCHGWFNLFPYLYLITAIRYLLRVLLTSPALRWNAAYRLQGAKTRYPSSV